MKIYLGMGIVQSQRSAASFSPTGLFSGGEQGVMFDHSDIATLFQDAGRTIPVTAPGQPVVGVADTSGRGNHATYANATYQVDGGGRGHVVFNGTTTGGSVTGMNLTGTDKISVFVGMRKLSDATTGVALETTVNSSGDAGAFALFAPADAATANYGFRARGLPANLIKASGFAAPHSAVITGTSDIAGDLAVMRINGAQVVQSVIDQGAGAFGNNTLYIGRRAGASVPLNGLIYGIVIVGKLCSAGEIAATEAWLNARTGAY